MRRQLQLKKIRVSYFILPILWLLTAWVCYWSGYWGGFVSSMRGEYAFVSAGLLYDIEIVRKLESRRVSLEDTKRILAGSIETRLETLSGTKKLLDDSHPYLRQFLYSFYDTPAMAYSVWKDRADSYMIDVPEIEERYRQAIGLREERKSR